MSYGLTELQAAPLVYATASMWREWESGNHRMSLAHWELFKIKAKEQNATERKPPEKGACVCCHRGLQPLFCNHCGTEQPALAAARLR